MQIEAAYGTRRRRMSLTSLIDVIFLLLLFFMLTATFSRFGDIELTAGSGTGAAQTGQIIFVQLLDSRLTLNGETMEWALLEEKLTALRDDGRADAVILAVGEGATAQQLIDMISTVNAIGDLPLHIVK